MRLVGAQLYPAAVAGGSDSGGKQFLMLPITGMRIGFTTYKRMPAAAADKSVMVASPSRALASKNLQEGCQRRSPGLVRIIGYGSP
jgi:hypothetical protein